MRRGLVSALRRDARGSALIEFAILAPVLFALMFGVFQIGLQMWNFNAVRSIASDTARFTIVEYQKKDMLTIDQIGSKAVALAVNTPYGLNIDNFNADVTLPATDIAGTKKIQIVISYVPPNPLGFFGIAAPTINSTKVVYVTG